eukprot:Phypoly_transcript_07260.p1 GENE.Phypoly_transcript_07260~~Phypoly_transcript_07260.p1  ORF type:complete len:522 (+),score=43.66 Phypoly_transcript_07260:49-1566(+)
MKKITKVVYSIIRIASISQRRRERRATRRQATLESVSRKTKHPMECDSTLECFPDELITHILSFLLPIDLQHLYLTSSRFYGFLLEDENLWRISLYRSCKPVQVVNRLPKSSRELLRIAKGYDTISEAIGAANEGEFLILLPGTFNEGIFLAKPLHIIGWDPDRTKTIVTTAHSCVVTCKAESGSIKNISLRQEFVRDEHLLRPMQYFCVDITSGSLLLTECDISSNGRSCVGIHQKEATPVIKNNVIHDSLAAGICVFEKCVHPLLFVVPFAFFSFFFFVKYSNILYLLNKIIYSSAPEIVDNEIFFSKYSGIEITMGACPTIKRNKIHSNVGSGVYVHNTGMGFLSENEIYNNDSSGVSIKSNGNPVLEKNIIRDGKRSGVYVYPEGRGKIIENKIINNAYNGIETLSQDVILENNEEYGNKKIPEDVAKTLAKGECTFGLTGKQHKVQDWYHCITCNLIGNDGCCVACANTCHKGHELQYYKFGLFFCDCGDRLANCKALRK